jgi:hypothetical protein
MRLLSAIAPRPAYRRHGGELRSGAGRSLIDCIGWSGPAPD